MRLACSGVNVSPARSSSAILSVATIIHPAVRLASGTPNARALLRLLPAPPLLAQLRDRRPWRDGLRVEHHLDQGWPLLRRGLGERVAELGVRGGAGTPGAEGAGVGREVGVLEPGADHALRVLALLVHADRAVHAVVH